MEDVEKIIKLSVNVSTHRKTVALRREGGRGGREGGRGGREGGEGEDGKKWETEGEEKRVR